MKKASIDVCKELVQNNHCEDVVRIYMTSDPGSGSQGRPPVHGKEILEYFEKNYKINKEIKEFIGFILSFYDILIQSYLYD